MATRRKKTASAEGVSQPVDGLTASSSDTQAEVPASAPVPKPKRAPRKKAEPSADASGGGVVIPMRPHSEMPPVSRFEHPIPAPISVPPRSAAIPVMEDSMAGDVWRPSKKVSRLEAEDILKEPEAPRSGDDADAPDFFRPPVRAGIFRKIGIGFALVALAVLIFVGYVMYAHATVVIHPKTVTVKANRTVTISAAPSGTEVSGKIIEVTVSGEKSAAPGFAASQAASNTPPAAPAPSAPTPPPAANQTYGGMVTLYNETSLAMPLLPSTRLLTPDGILFRLKDRVTIPANGSIKAVANADQPGQSGAIGPSTFTIPGLPVDKQKLVYAQSDAAMTPKGQAPASPAVVGSSSAAAVVQPDDIDAIEGALRAELISQAQDQAKKDETGDWSGKAYLVETMSRFVSAAPGQSVGTITVRLTLRVREVLFDRNKALAEATDDLQRGLTSDRQLTGVKSDTPDVVEEADPTSGTASLQMSISGQSSISMNSPLFDAEKLRGLDISAVQAYFDGIEGVDRVDVNFRPFWIKRMPDLKDHIDFQLATQN